MKNQRTLRNRTPKDRTKAVGDLGARVATAVRGGGHHRHVEQGYDVKQQKAV
jgi:hypothetical protein